MSACSIFGVFTLTDGVRLGGPGQSTTGSNTYYMQYRTVIECGDYRSPAPLSAVAASVRIYSPPHERNTPPLVDRTMAIIVGQFALGAAGQPAMIDASTLLPIPGNPALDDYDTTIPMFYPIISGVGSVFSHSPPGTLPRSFLLSVSEYVRGSSKTFTMRGVYEGDTGRSRWTNTPLPTLRSNMCFVGSCLGYVNGILDLSIVSVNFGATLTAPVDTSTNTDNTSVTSTSPSSSPPSKRARRTFADLQTTTTTPSPMLSSVGSSTDRSAIPSSSFLALPISTSLGSHTAVGTGIDGQRVEDNTILWAPSPSFNGSPSFSNNTASSVASGSTVVQDAGTSMGSVSPGQSAALPLASGSGERSEDRPSSPSPNDLIMAPLKRGTRAVPSSSDTGPSLTRPVSARRK
ncbi:hypothetical protein C8R42DRAFT_365730 [Lentinula raphanica]|nr:hypothetical protein C8R42DRAFT_365730 [Lentinula raphanica]